MVAAFQDGLNQTGFVDGRNAAIEYHWAEGDYDLLPWYAATLVNHKVAAIVAGGSPASLIAKSATTTIPIIFSSRADPVQIGIITALKQAGSNITGIVSMSDGLVVKQIEFVQVAPSATPIGVLVNPSNPNNPKEISEARDAQTLLGIKTTVLQARTSREIDRAFAKVVELKVGALVIGADPYFDSQLDKFAGLAARFGIPTIHPLREFAASGGLIGYGADLTDAYRIAGTYTGRILNGERPADLAVRQSTKVKLAVNLKAAKKFNLIVPQSVLATADEVIE
jgi:putative ABC transport system substrate-binding protein